MKCKLLGFHAYCALINDIIVIVIVIIVTLSRVILIPFMLTINACYCFNLKLLKDEVVDHICVWLTTIYVIFDLNTF